MNKLDRWMKNWEEKDFCGYIAVTRSIMLCILVIIFILSITAIYKIWEII